MNRMTTPEWKSRHWAIVFGIATFLALVSLSQAYLVHQAASQAFPWIEQATQTFTGWYLWAAVFPLVLILARQFPFQRGNRLLSLVVHIVAGAMIAVAHATIHNLVIQDPTPTARDNFLVPAAFWRFFVYQTMLSVCLALDYHRRVRDMEAESSRIEAGVLSAQIESLKMQLDPASLFKSLRRLSTLMHTDVEEADTMVARLGDYLRATLDRSRASEVTLREEIDSLRCYLEFETMLTNRTAVIGLDIEPEALDCSIPGFLLQASVEDAVKSSEAGESVHFQISARKRKGKLVLEILSISFRSASAPNSRFPQLLAGMNALYKPPVHVTFTEGATTIEIPLTLERSDPEEIARNLAPAEEEVPMQFPVDLPTNPVRKWLVITGVFTLLAVYFTIQNSILEAARGRSLNWPLHLLNCTGWYIWALITPVILRVSQKFPLQRNNAGKHLAVHAVVLTLSWVVASVAMGTVRWAANLGQLHFFQTLLESLARSPFSLDVICYSTIVAVESALRYYRRFEAESLRAPRLRMQLARARLQALKMQFHPHFLFNALNSLSELMQENPQRAEEMIVNLEKFLGLTLNSNPAQEIPFEEELEFLNCYLAIENIRFQNRLSVQMDIEPQVLRAPVPNLLLQPIVENAIKHGVAPRKGPGLIEILATRSHGMLKVSVRDNGPGFSAAQKKTARPRNGVGLSNTRERLTQLYGDAHHFELKSAPEGGLVVTMEIPVWAPAR